LVWAAAVERPPDDPDPDPVGLVVEFEPPAELEPPVELEPVAPKFGAATAVEGSTSAPLPQATSSPVDDFSVSVAGVLEPSAAAMVKRVVQVMLVVAGAVN